MERPRHRGFRRTPPPPPDAMVVVNGVGVAHMGAWITNPNDTSSVPRSSYVDLAETSLRWSR